MFDRLRAGFGMRADYNRGLWGPIRYAHAAIDTALDPFRPIGAWIFDDPQRRVWAVPMVFGVLLAFGIGAFDSAISAGLGSIRLGGDVRRELLAWQQFGGLVSVVVAGLVVLMLDPQGRRRAADLAVAWLFAGAVTHVLKLLIARPRPQYGQADVFLGPLAGYPVSRGGETVLQTSLEAGYHLASMPSSHTSAAAALAVFFARTYPKLSGLAWTLVGLVAFTRVWTNAHWPSDVIAGAAVGLAAAGVAVDRRWGRRLLDAVFGSRRGGLGLGSGG